MHVTLTALHAILLALVGIAAITDVRRGKVYNTLTYPGAALGLLLNGVGEPAGIGWEAAALGLAVGFGALLIAYLAGGLGGGDVKLMGMVGAFLGPLATAHALLYTFLVGAFMSLALIVWNEGVGGVFVRISRGIGGKTRRRVDETQSEGTSEPTDDDDDPETLRLPFAVAVLVGTAWVVLERAAGQSLLDLIGGRS